MKTSILCLIALVSFSLFSCEDTLDDINDSSKSVPVQQEKPVTNQPENNQ